MNEWLRSPLTTIVLGLNLKIGMKTWRELNMQVSMCSIGLNRCRPHLPSCSLVFGKIVRTLPEGSLSLYQQGLGTACTCRSTGSSMLIVILLQLDLLTDIFLIICRYFQCDRTIVPVLKLHLYCPLFASHSLARALRLSTTYSLIIIFILPNTLSPNSS